MAPVTRPRDRGQLILVAGLTVAVILVMLVLLLNTVIYTENLATRGIDSGAGDAIEYRATVVGSVGELIERENEHYDEGHPPSEGVTADVGMINGALSERHLERGTIAAARADAVTIDEGSPRIWRNESGDLSAAGGEPDWTVMTDASDVERFTLVVVSVDPYEDGEESDNDRLRVIINSTAENPWILEINASGTASYEVIVNGSDPITYQTDTLNIDLVAGTINDTEVFAPPSASGTIAFENGDTTMGTFTLHATGTVSENDLTAYDGGSGLDPYYTYPVESVDLTLHYETSRLRFVTEETILPEEEP